VVVNKRSKGNRGKSRSRRHKAAKSRRLHPKPKASSHSSYAVGWCHPPKEHQFRRGHSGNPSGKRKEHKSLLSDLNALLERALNSPHGERKQIVTKFAAGIDALANQFADGDPRARRDLFAITEKHGIDFGSARDKARRLDPNNQAEIQQALIDRGVPPRLLPPIDDAGLEPPPDPPLPSDIEEADK
jgi:hypothetical protein